MTPSGIVPPIATGRLLLRAERPGDRGEVVRRDYPLPPNESIRLGREPRRTPAEANYDPDYGADMVIRGDGHISNNHATLTWAGGKLRVVKNPKAKNPIYQLDLEDADIARPMDDMTLGLFGRFRIGNTVFTALPDQQSGPAEHTIGGDELRAVSFVDPAPRIDALSGLPDLISSSPDDGQLQDELLKVLLRGIPRADVAALVGLVGDELTVQATRWRDGLGGHFRPSRRLVMRAIRGFENTQYVWGPEQDMDAEDVPTWNADSSGWAVCVPLLGSSSEGLYVSGRLTPDLTERAGMSAVPALFGDMKFARLTGDIYSGLRDLRSLQRRDGFLGQMLAPVVRQAISGERKFEEVIRRRELPVTVLFCDLRGFTQAVAAGEADLMGTWDMLSEALEAMTGAIVEQDGVIGDFQGDAAMGFWGWPLPQEDQIDRAAKAALNIRRRFVQFSKRPNHPLANMACGVGLAYGNAVAGKLGSFDQMKIGVFGPPVNRAARLEAATKALRTPILVDQAVLTHLVQGTSRPWCRIRRVAKVTPQGFNQPVLVGELLPHEGEAGPNLGEMNRRLYEAALDRFLAGDWDDARKRLAHLPADGPADFLKRFLRQCEDDARRQGKPDAEVGKPPADWDGGIAVAK